MTERDYYWENDEVTSTHIYSYTYDKNNNWVKKVFEGYGKASIAERVIEYY